MNARDRWRRIVAGLAGAAFLAGGTTAAAVPPGAQPAAREAVDKIDAALATTLEEDGRTDFWLRFVDRPNLDQLVTIPDWDARGQAVHDALTASARTSQQQALATLEDEGVAHRSFWITNAIRVEGGTRELALELAADARVEGLYPTKTYEEPDPTPVELSDVGPDAVEWGIADINADDVWADFGVTGEGIVIANLDSGVQWDHPALIEQYRGWDGATADHDYNWFDGTPENEPAPWDWAGHGTHTMGTMAGDDGGDNQIGVAPGVSWIAASTDLSDAMMFAAGEWLLAPTEVGGANPDPSMRPHVINNSWGSGMPTNDPFMEDIIEAWHAAGQFSVFSNGNEGPSCETSGSPGSRILTYSVGSYDPSHAISDFSSRGPGQDGEVKPDIAAPGDGVRSSVPGNGYEVYSGTSMAAPHVAGSVALMWASSPQLVGDVEMTRDLLDGTAIDTEDLQCGGTAENDNVFGEGRLDALALVAATPRGDIGYLEGTVTDAASGDPLPAVEVILDGPLDRTLRTGPDGGYRALVMAGDYTVSASKFGWVTDSASVNVPVDTTVVQDFALDQAPSGTLTGTVTDGSGQGYPLYARVSVAGTDLATYTDPVDGSYALDIPLDTYVLVNVTVQYPGYQLASQEMQLTGDTEHDFAVPVDSFSCIANGYEVNVDGVTETFDDLTLPAGWAVEDHAGTGQVWTFDDPAGRGNMTGGEGGFAIVDSDWYGPDGYQDTSLVSPSFDLSGRSDPVLTFQHYYESLGDRADVDVSVDGGATWATSVSYGGMAQGQDMVPLPTESDVRIRFHYYDAFWAWFWQVDDVFVGDRTCDPVGEGGYVVGTVRSSLQDQPIRGARVTSLENPSDMGITRDTPADEGQDDGFYWLFSHLAGTHPFEASARLYTSQVQDVAVPDGGAVRADYVLGGGLLTVGPSAIDTEVVLGTSATEDLTVTNEGDGTVDIELLEVRGDFVLQRSDGSRMSTSEAQKMPGAEPRRVETEASVEAFPRRGTGERPASYGPTEEPWEELTPYPVAVLDHRVVNLDGTWYTLGGTDGFEGFTAVRAYDNATMTWTDVTDLPLPRHSATVGAVNGMIVLTGGWTPEGGTGVETFLYDPATDNWSGGADNPVAAISSAGSAVLDGQLYSVGGCTTGECVPMSSSVTAYDQASDSWTQLADYPLEVAFPACGAIDGQLYCTGGTNESGTTAQTYSYDPGSDTWTQVADAPATTWGTSHAAANGMLVITGGIVDDDISNEAWGYDPTSDAWVDLPNPNTPTYRGAAACGIVRVGGDTGGFLPTDVVEHLPGFDDCGDNGTDVPWLHLSRTEATLEPGGSVTVQVTTDGDVPQPGSYSAGVKVVGGVPGSEPTVPVTMTVTPPATWGKLAGLVEGESCIGELYPIPGASVDATPTRTEQPHWRMVTDEEGRYARWIDTRMGELELIASATMHLSESALVTPLRGQVTEQDFDLLHATCEVPPGPIHPDVRRIYGTDRYGTAAALTQIYAPGVETVFVATGATYPDAIAAAARAGSLDSPVLLTRPELLPWATSAELRRLDPQEVVVLGGEGAVSDAVVRAIESASAAPTRRLAGTDRYRTAALIAAEVQASDVVFVATGQDYPDALAGAARAGALDAPVLLTRTDSLPSATIAQLQRLDPSEIVVLGGTGVVSAAVETALGAYGEVTRVAGSNRYETAAAIAEAYPTVDGLYIASGQNWPDALAGAARAGSEDVPILLVRSDAVPGATWSSLERLEPGRITVLGGPVAVSEEVVERLRTLE